MGLDKTERAPQQDVHNTHDNVSAQQRGATDNLQHSAQQNTSKDVSSEKAYWSSQSQKGTASHLHDMHIDFGSDHSPYTPELKRGEGPYQAFRKMGQSPEEAARAGHEVNKETGHSKYGQGDSFKFNQDGSVTHRENSRTQKDSYTEKTSKDGKVLSEHSHTVAADGSSTDVSKDANSTTTKKRDPQGQAIGEERQTRDGSRSGWTKNSDGSTTTYSSPDKDHKFESTSKDDKMVSESSTTNTPEGQIKTDKKYDDKGNSVETGTGPKPENNFTKTDDGKGNTLYHQADGKGYSRTQESDGSFVESHYGPSKADSYTVKGDGKGHNAEIREGENGTRTEKHTFPDSSRNYTAEVKPEPSGGYTEKRSFADSTKDHTLTHTPDGKGGYVEKYNYADNKKDYTKEVGADGKTVYTDNVGLKAEVHNASPEFQQKAWDEIRKLPEADRKLLADKGTTYAIGGKMSDIDPSLAGVQPRGWPPGKTWDDADGGFNSEKNRISVTEKTNSGPSTRTEGVVRHETGHAIDQALSQFSHSETFQKAYDQDVAKLSDGEKSLKGYLLQQNKAGQEETFAEVYGAMNGSSSNPRDTQGVLKDFPNVAEAIKKRLAEGN